MFEQYDDILTIEDVAEILKIGMAKNLSACMLRRFEGIQRREGLENPQTGSERICHIQKPSVNDDSRIHILLDFYSKSSKYNNRIGEILSSPSTPRSVPFGTTRFNSLHELSDSGLT